MLRQAARYPLSLRAELYDFLKAPTLKISSGVKRSLFWEWIWLSPEGRTPCVCESALFRDGRCFLSCYHEQAKFRIGAKYHGI